MSAAIPGGYIIKNPHHSLRSWWGLVIFLHGPTTDRTSRDNRRRGEETRSRLAAALPTRSHRPAGGQEAAGNLAQCLQEAARANVAHALRRPARPGQNH